MNNMNKQKKPYTKPCIVFENFETGELTGSPEMIEKILAESEKHKTESTVVACPFEDMPCLMR